MSKRFEYKRMTAAEFSAALTEAAMKPNTFARLFGVDSRTVRRWLAGTFEIPPWVDVVLRLLVTAGGAHGWLRKAASEVIVRDNEHPERGEYPYRRIQYDD